jgi:hypothetical protein
MVMCIEHIAPRVNQRSKYFIFVRRSVHLCAQAGTSLCVVDTPLYVDVLREH